MTYPIAPAAPPTRAAQVAAVARRANNLWLALWAAIAAGLIAAAFLLPFYWWFIPFAVGFGVPETIGNVWPHDGRYPPLTDVIRVYVPRFLALAAMGGLWTAACVTWGWQLQPWAATAHGLAICAFVWAFPMFFLVNHFIQRYDEPAAD